MNEQALIDELKLPQYAGLTDQQAADTVNAKTVQIRRPVDAGRLMDAMMSLGVWQKLEAAAPPGSTDPPASTARTMMTRLNQSRPVDLDNPAVQSIVNDCITHNLMTQAEATQLNTLGDAVITWTTANDVGDVGLGAVINARRAIAGGA
jgi:hypothetical protein